MNRTLACVTCGALLVFSGGPYALTIDDFSDGVIADGTFLVTAPNTVSQTQSGTMLGGARDVTLEAVGSISAEVKTLPAGLSPNRLDLAVSALTTANLTVTWDDFFEQDLTMDGATGLFLGIPSVSDQPFDVTFTLEDTGSSQGDISRNFPNGTSGSNFFFPFAGFSGSVDFTKVTSISLLVATLANGADLDIDFVETRVPIPGSLALLGIGLIALKARRRSDRV
jgi:hypothetical protein